MAEWALIRQKSMLEIKNFKNQIYLIRKNKKTSLALTRKIGVPDNSKNSRSFVIFIGKVKYSWCLLESNLFLWGGRNKQPLVAFRAPSSSYLPFTLCFQTNLQSWRKRSKRKTSQWKTRVWIHCEWMQHFTENWTLLLRSHKGRWGTPCLPEARRGPPLTASPDSPEEVRQRLTIAWACSSSGRLNLFQGGWGVLWVEIWGPEFLWAGS